MKQQTSFTEGRIFLLCVVKVATKMHDCYLSAAK